MVGVNPKQVLSFQDPIIAKKDINILKYLESREQKGRFFKLLFIDCLITHLAFLIDVRATVELRVVK